MARKLRLEFPGAIYHVINRGNYRLWIFREEKTKHAFERCLFDACRRSHWRLHAFGIMDNHFHLALETPEGNLVAGMQWLQATFANRFNRFRGERGHLFQARYKSLLVESGEALGQLCHYIHLNPVRAGLVTVERLADFRYSSYWYVEHPTVRPDFLTAETALQSAGELPDSRAGRCSYHDYLTWQAAEGPAGKSKAYVSLSKGWVIGTAGFKAALIADHKLQPDCRAWETAGAEEIRAQQCRAALERALAIVERTPANVEATSKSASWKLAIAAWLKESTEARTKWIAQALALGAPSAVSRNLATYRRRVQPTDPIWRKLTSLSST